LRKTRSFAGRSLKASNSKNHEERFVIKTDEHLCVFAASDLTRVTVRFAFHRDAQEKRREHREGRGGVLRISSLMVILERNKAFRPFLLGARNGISCTVAHHGPILHNAETHRRKLLKQLY